MTPSRQKRTWRVTWLILALVMMTGGCGWMPAEPTHAPPPLPSPTPTPPATPTPTATPTPSLTTLRLWVPDFLDPYDETTGAAPLADLLDAFARTHLDVQVQLLVKKAEGPGGLYHLLSTAYDVAPAVLPDLILLGEDDMRTAARAGLVQPLEPQVISEDFFPFTRAAATHDGTVYGIPFIAWADHTIYREGVSTTPPLTWTDVLSSRYTLLFPAAPPDRLADDALLVAYLSTGGEVVDEEGNAVLERVNLEMLYRFFLHLMDARLLDPDIALTLPDAAACWEAYRDGKGRLAPVPAGRYWQAPTPYSRPAWFPTPDGDPLAIGHTWYAAVVSTDPKRQEQALALALWLTVPRHMAELTASTGLLPTRAQALAEWPLMPEDMAFLGTLLTHAVPNPPVTVDESVRRALQAGLAALLKGEVETPDEAATYALSQLR